MADKVPDEYWDAARELRNIVLWQSNSSIEPLARFLLARDTAARKECAEIARRYPERDPAEDGNGYWAAEEIATAIEATIGGAK